MERFQTPGRRVLGLREGNAVQRHRKTRLPAGLRLEASQKKRERKEANMLFGFNGRATRNFLILLVSMHYILFIDRVNLAAAAPVMQQDLGLSNLALGVAFSAFNYSYAPFQLVGGWFAGRFGARRTLTVCGLVWSLTTIATGAVSGLASLFGVRLVLGMGEGATLPAATRAVSKWTPIVKRGTAIGATHAAGRLGAGTAAPIVAFLITWFS